MSSRNPTLEEVLSIALEAQMGRIHTSIPGRIESYDSSTQKATVKPLVKNVEIPSEGNEIVDDLPVINDVPVIFPRSAGFFLSFKVAPGDLVLLLFCERSVDEWVHGNGENQEPADPRRHSLSDAVCIPGLFPFKKALKNSDTSGVKLGEDSPNGMRLEIAGGKLILTLADQATVVFQLSEAGATMTLGTGIFSPAIAEQLEILWTALVAYLTATAASITALGGAPPAPPPPWVPTIASTKVKVPG